MRSIEEEQIFTIPPGEALDALHSIAERNAISLEQALGLAIVDEKFLEDQIDAGAKLLIEIDGKIKHLEYR